ncbi:MAG: histidine phosphatase family protein [Clostridia bacterium]|nr:histidine phosphatase family protein [Clostridia bacterium]
MLFYYVRHGDPIYDPDSLTPLGERQAEALSRRFALHGLDEIYASTSNRAILTATPTSEVLKKKITLLDWANEGHAWNELTVKTPEGKRWLFHRAEIKELFHTPEIVKLGFEWYTHPAFAEYNYKAGLERIQKESDAFFEAHGYKHEGGGKYKVVEKNSKRIALFAHQGFGLAFLSCLLAIPYPQFCSHFDLGHTSMTAILFEEENGYAYPRVISYSNDSHIYREGLPTKYCNTIYF